MKGTSPLAAWARSARILLGPACCAALPLLLAAPGSAQTASGAASGRAIPASAAVVRSLSLDALPQRAELDVSGYKLNVDSLRPYLARTQARVDQLRALGGLARIVQEPTSQLTEYTDGLRITTRYAYQLRATACLDQRTLLAGAGLSCGGVTNLQQQIADLGDPRSSSYVENEAARLQATANLQSVQASMLSKAGPLRAALDQPATVAQLGAAEVARLKALDDQGLVNAALNAGQTSVDEQIFIPAVQARQNLQASSGLVDISAPTQVAPSSRIRPESFQGTSLAPEPAGQVPVSRQPATALFVTGFTLGREYQWSRRYTKTVNWCGWLYDCPSTYYVEPYARLGYGLGLRFPIRLSMSATPTASGMATLKTNLDTLDGTIGDYRGAGISDQQLFGGKELVAELEAKAGLRYDLPVVGEHDKVVGLSVDLADKLPPPLKGGNFKPPLPPSTLPLGAPFVLSDVDLLGGQANFGVVAATVNPAIQLALSSERLSLDLIDNSASTPTPIGVSNGATVPVVIRNQIADITVNRPTYNLRFDITPGLRFGLKVDLAVWGDHWNEDVWIPQLSIHLPPNGMTFTCHAGTRCDKRFQMAVGGIRPGSIISEPMPVRLIGQ